MDVVIGLFLLAAFFAVIGFVIRFAWRILVGLFRLGTTPVGHQQRPQYRDSGITAEEEGNVHSGPHGYSPNTAYPETQYGSDFNPEAEWNHEES